MFKKVLLSLLLTSSITFASLKHIEASPTSIKNIKIIDIRTPPEWKETGIVKNSYTVMFFDEKGAYDVKNFISELNKIVKEGE